MAGPDPDLPEPDLTDPDNPEWTEEDFARAIPFEDLPEAAQRVFGKNRRAGRPPAAVTKELTSLRLDPDVLDHFKAGGPGWQTRINAALREAMARGRG